MNWIFFVTGMGWGALLYDLRQRFTFKKKIMYPVIESFLDGVVTNEAYRPDLTVQELKDVVTLVHHQDDMAELDKMFKEDLDI